MLIVARLAAVIGTACMFIAGGAAHAQERNVSVRDRVKQQFGEGVRAGAFRIYPEASADVGYNSNVYAADTTEESDTVVNLGARLAAESNWSTHRLNLSLGATSSFYSELSDQDTTDVFAAANGRYDITRRSYLTLDLGYQALHESIAESPSQFMLGEPIAYTRSLIGAGFSQTFNRVRVSGFGRMIEDDFDDGVFLSGIPLEQDDRDVSVTEGGLRVDYALSAATSLFIAGNMNTREHDLEPPAVAINRNSEGRELLAGVSVDLTDLVRGEFAIGQFNQEYDEPGVEDTESLALRSRLEWFPDELVSITLSANRNAGNSGVVGAAGYVNDTFEARVDYEFRRNIILGAAYRLTRDDYVGIDREDERQGVEVSADYMLNRNWSLYASAGRLSQESSGAPITVGREYDIDRLTLGVRFRR